MDTSASLQTREIHVTGTDRFRRVALFGTLIAGVFSLLLKLLEPRKCEQVDLETAVIICFGVHCSTFIVLLFSYLFNKCFIKLGRLMGLFYVAIVGAMIVV